VFLYRSDPVGLQTQETPATNPLHLIEFVEPSKHNG